MHFPAEEWFVGAVAVGVGVASLYASAVNWESSYSLVCARWVEARFGRLGARVFYAALGVALLALGAAIALGAAQPSPGKDRERAGGDNLLLDTPGA